jgi:hypothetical protein
MRPKSQAAEKYAGSATDLDGFMPSTWFVAVTELAILQQHVVVREELAILGLWGVPGESRDQSTIIFFTASSSRAALVGAACALTSFNAPRLRTPRPALHQYDSGYRSFR